MKFLQNYDIIRGMKKSAAKLKEIAANKGLGTSKSKEEFLTYFESIMIKEDAPEAKLNEKRQEEIALILKDYSRYSIKQHKNNLKQRNLRFKHRQETLMLLKEIDLSLYFNAITPDYEPFPSSINEPTETPPILGYSTPANAMLYR